MTHCPKCGEKLGRWKFRIVHGLFAGWYYECECGYQSRKVKDEKALQKVRAICLCVAKMP